MLRSPHALSALCAVFVLSSLMTGSALAADRYELGKTKSGTIRLDKKTGAVSYCREVSTGVACSLAADERHAWQDELDSMAKRIDLLEMRLAHLEAIGESSASSGEVPRPKVDIEPKAEIDIEPKVETGTNNEVDTATGDKSANSDQLVAEPNMEKVKQVAETFVRRMISAMKDIKRNIETY